LGHPVSINATSRVELIRQHHILKVCIFPQLSFPYSGYSRRADHAGLVSSPPPPVNCLILLPSLLASATAREN
jgi:hypothetical protein